MSELTDQLRAEGLRVKGTDLGGLLQWAALHIESQDEALAEEREECAKMEGRVRESELAIESIKEATLALNRALQQAAVPGVDLARDMCGHINLMAGHGDPDYLLKNGKSVRHIDLRTAKPRKKKEIA